MNTFNGQLEAVRANMARLEALFLASPDLFTHGHGLLLEPDRVRVYLHASLSPSDFDWRVFAGRYKAADWKRVRSASGSGFDFVGTLNGVELTIIGAERLPAPVVLFDEASVA